MGLVESNLKKKKFKIISWRHLPTLTLKKVNVLIEHHTIRMLFSN